MPKALVISDTHNEYLSCPIIPLLPDVKFLILAGDIGCGSEHRSFIEYLAKHYTVLYILGNHEFYESSLEEVRRYWRSVTINNFYFLDNSSVIIDDINFIGSTLWMDFDHENTDCMEKAYRDVRDLERIELFKGVKLTPHDLVAEFSLAVDFIEGELSHSLHNTNVVISHHAPSHLSVHPDFRHSTTWDSSKNHFFASHLDYLIQQYQPTYWIHGHMHTSAHYLIGATQVLCNPIGGGQKHNAEFDPYKIINL